MSDRNQPAKPCACLVEGTDTHLAELEEALMNCSNVVGLFYPTERIGSGYAVYAADEIPEEPLPPTDLRHWYGFKDGKWDDDLYLKSGQLDVRKMREAACRDGFDLASGPILEFGCSSGRMLRHLKEEAGRTECWGCDIHAEAIHWAQAHLPHFNFFVNTTTPHLPFQDGYFNFIYAGSVFTHIGELDDFWLLELRRILRPRGRLYITLSDETTLKIIRETRPDHPSNQHVDEFAAASNVFERPWLQFVSRTTPWLQRSVYNRERWLTKVDAWFDVLDYQTSAYGWQSAALLQNRLWSAPGSNR
jgi:ubiquinone/menaquinone biosynthesis C-methylase UbiE